MKQFKAELKKLFILGTRTQKIFFDVSSKQFDIPEGLNKTHLKTLTILKYNKKCTMHELSNKVDLEKGSFTPVAKKLSKLGYISKVNDCEDKRKVFITLTKKGVNLTKAFNKVHRKHVNAIFEKLTVDERKEYFVMVEKLIAFNEKLEN
jgi:DNA-binding MarR family transcriptional regulator